jgi:uncharacterized cupin superfamily protein
VIPEASAEQTEHGTVVTGDGWFVLNARDAPWRHGPERPAICDFEGETHFEQVGINVNVLGPGEAMSMYHWEADQEDFLIVAGVAILVIEGEERPLRQWDFVHCPPGASHTIVGAGGGPCVVVAIGARDRSEGPHWGGYPVDETARRLNASAERETTEPAEAYARFQARTPTAYREGWL